LSGHLVLDARTIYEEEVVLPLSCSAMAVFMSRAFASLQIFCEIDQITHTVLMRIQNFIGIQVFESIAREEGWRSYNQDAASTGLQ
jgi:hypothetical protein